MKTKKVNKSAKIREALLAGSAPKDIAAKLKVPVSYVYNENWKMKKPAVRAKAVHRKKVSLRRSEVTIANALGISVQDYAKEKLKMQEEELNKSAEHAAYMNDLVEIRRQITDLHVIEAFLQVRISQMEQNAQWLTKA